MKKDASVDRRAFVGVGAMAGLSMLCSLSHERTARAGTITSWDFPMNADMSSDAVAERFEDIARSYGEREPLCDEDADFVLRYALPTPIGSHAVQVNAAAAEEGYQLRGSASLEYVGNFIYRNAATIQAGSSESFVKNISIQATHTIFGYTHPFNGSSLGIIGHFEYEESAQNRDWFTLEMSDDVAGVAVALWPSYQATVTADDGREIQLQGACTI